MGGSRGWGGTRARSGGSSIRIADIVSFGVAPALMVYKVVLIEFPTLGWIVASLYLLCGALRLARFNCLAASNPGAASKEFRGFPIPAAAGLTASLTLFMLWMAEERAATGTVEVGAAGAADFPLVHDVQPVPVPQLQGAELAHHAVDPAIYRDCADPWVYHA